MNRGGFYRGLISVQCFCFAFLSGGHVRMQTGLISRNDLVPGTTYIPKLHSLNRFSWIFKVPTLSIRASSSAQAFPWTKATNQHPFLFSLIVIVALIGCAKSIAVASGLTRLARLPGEIGVLNRWAVDCWRYWSTPRVKLCASVARIISDAFSHSVAISL